MRGSLEEQEMRLKSESVEERLEAVRSVGKLSDARSIDLLISALGDSEWRVRKAAVSAFLHHVEGCAQIPSLIRCLACDDNAGMRNAATEALIQFGKQAVLPLLTDMNQFDKEVKKFIIDILGDIQDARATPALLSSLTDEDENVQLSAIESLGKIKDDRAIDPLIEILKHDNHLRAFTAIKALERLGHPRAVEPLMRVMGKPILQRAALEALGRMGDIRALNIVVGQLQGPARKVRDSALKALMWLTEGQPDSFSITLITRLREAYNKDLFSYLMTAVGDKEPLIQKGAIRALGWLSETKAIGSLLPHLDGEHREEVIASLVNMKREVVGPLSMELVRQGDAVREGIAVVLGKIGDRKATPSLIRLLSDPCGHVRQSSAVALGRIKDPSAVRGLLQLLDDPYSNVQQASVASLGQMKSSSLIAVLIGMLQHEKPAVRANAASVLGQYGEEEAISKLSFLMKDPLPEVRQAAVQALSSFEQHEARSVILLALGDESPAVRIAAIKVLERRKGTDGLDQMEALSRDENIWVRTNAIRLLGKVGGPRMKERLIDLLNSEKVGVVKISAMEVLCRFKDPDLTPLFMSLLSSTDMEVRKAAILAMGENGDRKVAAAVRECLVESSWMIRSAAARAVGALQDVESTSKLEEMARIDPDPLVQESALFALAQIESGRR